MGYSCTDFTDSILDALGITVPEDALDDPEAQADLALAEIKRLQEAATNQPPRQPFPIPETLEAVVANAATSATVTMPAAWVRDVLAYLRALP
jgi:hypothetical protein